MSMKQVRELFRKWQERISNARDCGVPEWDDEAETIETCMNELNSAIAPDWKPASEPPDDRKCVWLLSNTRRQIGYYVSASDIYYDTKGRQVFAVTHWHEIEVPEPPEVGT